jgi:glutaredoxin
MKIIIYTKTGCPWCREVLEFFKDRKILFEEREVLGNQNYWREMMAKSGQTKAPVVEIDGFILADTDAAAVAKYLDGVGSATL